MAVGNVLRDMFVNVFFKVNPASQQALNTSLTGSVLKANLLSQALEGFARTLARGIGQAVDNLARLNVVAARTNTTVEAIRNMQYAAQKMGVDMHGATAALENFQKQINQNPNYQKYWEDLIPDMKKVTDTSDKLMKIFEFLSKQPRYLAEAYNTKLGLGIPPDLFDVIMKQFSKYREALEEHDKLMKRFKTTQKEAATASFELHQAFTKFGVIFDAFFTKATITLLPTFNKLLGWSQEKAEGFFDAWNKYGPQVEATVKKIGDSFKDWGSFLGKSLEIVLLLKSSVLQIAASLLPIAVAVSAAIKLLEEERALKKQKEAEAAEGRGEGPGTGPAAFERMRRMHTSQRDRILESLGMGAQIKVAPAATPEEKKIEQSTQETAKNTAIIAEHYRKSNAQSLLERAYNSIRSFFGLSGAGIGGAELPGGGGGTGGGAGGGTGRGGPGGSGGGGSGRRGEYPAARAAALARKMGATEEEARQLGALVGGESSGDPGATRINAKEHSIGLWQINQNAWRSLGYTDEQLKNPEINAKAAIAVLRKQGLGAWYNTSRSAGFQNSMAQAALGAANPDQYIGAPAAVTGGKYAGMDPELARRTKAYIDAHPGAYLSSGKRSPEHNRAVGGAPGSAHLEGRAADIGGLHGRTSDMPAWGLQPNTVPGEPWHVRLLAEQMRSKKAKMFDNIIASNWADWSKEEGESIGGRTFKVSDADIERVMAQSRSRPKTTLKDISDYYTDEIALMKQSGLTAGPDRSLKDDVNRNWRIKKFFNMKMNTERMPMSKNIDDMRQPFDVMFGKTPLSDSHNTFSPTSNVNMTNSNTFHLNGASPQDAVRIGTMVGRTNEDFFNKNYRQKSSNTMRGVIPRVT